MVAAHGGVSATVPASGGCTAILEVVLACSHGGRLLRPIPAEAAGYCKSELQPFNGLKLRKLSRLAFQGVARISCLCPFAFFCKFEDRQSLLQCPLSHDKS